MNTTKKAPAALTTDEKLVILMEECAEVIKAASKCLRFGFTCEQQGYGRSGRPAMPRNDEDLAAEIGDVLGMVDSLLLSDHYWRILAQHRVAKLAKAEKAKAEFGASHE